MKIQKSEFIKKIEYELKFNIIDSFGGYNISPYGFICVELKNWKKLKGIPVYYDHSLLLVNVKLLEEVGIRSSISDEEIDDINDIMSGFELSNKNKPKTRGLFKPINDFLKLIESKSIKGNLE